MKQVMRRFGPLATYVDKPARDGVGKGLVRRHDAVLNYFRERQAAGRLEPFPVTVARTNLFRGIFVERGVRRAEGADALTRNKARRRTLRGSAAGPQVRAPGDARGSPPLPAKLIEHPGFIAAASPVPGGAQVRPTMLYANVLVCGQELAVHQDTPEFRGLDKLQVPEWFLVVMGASGLFERSRVQIAAAVSFFSGCEGGDFLLWPDGPDSPPTRIPPRFNTAVALDADRLAHGVARVGGESAAAPPVSPESTIEWDGEAWRLRRHEALVRSYAWDEVRLSFQWKAQVAPAAPGRSEPVDEATALDRLVADLRARGVVQGDPPTGPGLALTLIDTYLRFPRSLPPA